MRALEINTDTMDTAQDFALLAPSTMRDFAPRRLICRIRKDYAKPGDGILWAMQCSATIKDTYTAEDIARADRLANAEPFRHGEYVLIGKATYRFRVQGNFSDAAILDLIEQMPAEDADDSTRIKLTGKIGGFQ